MSTWQDKTEDVMSDILDDRGWDDYEVDAYPSQTGKPKGKIVRDDVVRTVDFTPGTTIDRDNIQPEIIEAVREIEQLTDDTDLLDQMEKDL